MILLDKSAFESLSQREHELFSWYFHFQVVPPIMVIEIMADLSKSDPSATSPEALVQRLANKFMGSGPPVHIDHTRLLRNDLLGAPVALDGHMYTQATRVVTDPVHGPGMVIDISPTNERILRWSDGKFSEGEKRRAEAWRAIPAGWDEHLTRKKSRLAKSMDEVESMVDAALNDPDGGSYWLGALCEMAGLGEKDRVNVFDRWLRDHMELRTFTPYGYHCMKATLAYMVAADSELVPEAATDPIDVTYLYYTPFCDVFVSEDRVHKRLAPLLLRTDQEFVPFAALKDDLRERCEESEDLDEGARTRRQFSFGMYPVPRRGSIITRLFLKYAGMWPGSGNRAIKLSAEEQELARKEARQACIRAEIHSIKRKDDSPAA